MSPASSPLLISIPQTARYLGVSRTTVYELIRSDPTFPPILKVRNATRIEFRALCAWIALRGEIAAHERGSRASVRGMLRQTA